MKKFLMGAAATAALMAGTASAYAEAVTIQLKWVTQAQFAGYYVAEKQGFYKDAGLDVTMKPEDLVVFKYEDQGVATLEDGLYVLEDKLKDPAFVTTMAKFVKASMKGWDWAREHPDDAAKIVLDNDATGAQTEGHQKTMMQEVNKLTEGSDGTLDVAAAERTVDTLMKGGSDPVISKKPEGAWTSVVTDE